MHTESDQLEFSSFDCSVCTYKCNVEQLRACSECRKFICVECRDKVTNCPHCRTEYKVCKRSTAKDPSCCGCASDNVPLFICNTNGCGGDVCEECSHICNVCGSLYHNETMDHTDSDFQMLLCMGSYAKMDPWCKNHISNRLDVIDIRMETDIQLVLMEIVDKHFDYLDALYVQSAKSIGVIVEPHTDNTD